MEENLKNRIFYGARSGGIAFCLMITIYVFLSLIGQAIISAFFNSSDFWYVFASSFFSIISLAVATLVFCKGRGGFFKQTNAVKCGGGFFVLSVMLAAGMFFGLGFVNDCLIKLLNEIGLKTSSITVPLDNVWQLVAFIISLAVLPAIAEELFFRGVFLNSLKAFNKCAAIVLSALFFSLYHCSCAQLIYQFIYGLLFTVLASKSKSVYPCMAAHFINNATVLILEYFGVTIDFLNPLIISSGIILLILFVVLTLRHKEIWRFLKRLFVKKGGNGTATSENERGIVDGMPVAEAKSGNHTEETTTAKSESGNRTDGTVNAEVKRDSRTDEGATSATGNGDRGDEKERFFCGGEKVSSFILPFGAFGAGICLIFIVCGLFL